MSRTAVVLVVVLAIFFTVAYSDSNFEYSFDNAKMKMKENFDRHQMTSVLEEMALHEILKNAIHENQIYVLTEKEQNLAKISGKTLQFGKSGSVEVSITKPDNSVAVLYTPISETGAYTTFFPIKGFMEGEYRVSLKFGNKDFPGTSFYISAEKIKTSFPDWFETNFQWWAENKISDNEFVWSLQHLIDNDVIKIILKGKLSEPKVTVKGEQMVRSGTTHSIITHVIDGHVPVEGAKVTLRIEDYGEDEIRSFQGFTNRNGEFVFSWEIPKSFDDYETLLAYISVTHGEFSETRLFKFQIYCLPGEKGCKIEGN